jgi:hypothetical protein
MNGGVSGGVAAGLTAGCNVRSLVDGDVVRIRKVENGMRVFCRE